jgi:hypothetical protein
MRPTRSREFVVFSHSAHIAEMSQHSSPIPGGCEGAKSGDTIAAGKCSLDLSLAGSASTVPNAPVPPGYRESGRFCFGSSGHASSPASPAKNDCNIYTPQASRALTGNSRILTGILKVSKLPVQSAFGFMPKELVYAGIWHCVAGAFRV